MSRGCGGYWGSGHAIERAVEIRRHLAVDLAIADVGFELVQRRGRRISGRSHGRTGDLRADRRGRLCLRAVGEQRANACCGAESARHEGTTIDLGFFVSSGFVGHWGVSTRC
jgi:hypothetical protein